MILNVLIIAALCAFATLTYIPEVVWEKWSTPVRKGMAAFYFALAGFLLLTGVYLGCKTYGVIQ